MAYDVPGVKSSLSVTRVARYPLTPGVIEQFTPRCAVDPHFEQQCLLLHFAPNLQLPRFQNLHASGTACGDAAPPPNALAPPPNALVGACPNPPPNAPVCGDCVCAAPNAPGVAIDAPAPPNGDGGCCAAPNPPNPPPNAIARATRSARSATARARAMASRAGGAARGVTIYG